MTDTNQEVAAEILSHSIKQQAKMVELLKQAVNLESPSQLANTQRPVFQLFRDQLELAGYRSRFVAGKSSGGQMLAIPRERNRSHAQQLILGHVDTVWPLGTLDTMPIESRNGCLHGPGSYDMKAGLVQAVFAVQTLQDLGLNPSAAHLFPELGRGIGSHDSVRQIECLASGGSHLCRRTIFGSSGKLKLNARGWEISNHGQRTGARWPRPRQRYQRDP